MFCDNLKEIRMQRKISQKKLSEHLFVSQQAVAKWELGKATPDPEMIAKIADHLQVDVDTLLGRTRIQTDDEKKERSKGVRIKVFGNIAAGIPIEAIEDFADDDPDCWEEISESLARTGDFIALRIDGDSMEPRMKKGDVVIVRLQPDIESGEIAAVYVNGYSATCKKVLKDSTGLTLVSFNPSYDPKHYSKKEVMELPVKILGKVVELRAKF